MSYRAIQDECYEANLQLPKFGLVDLTFGNVSVIDRGSGIFGIKPSGVDYSKLKPDDIVLIDLEGRQVSGALRPSSDTPTHRRLFQAFLSIRAVVHTHSRNAVSFAQAGKPIPCLGTTHADYFYGQVPVTRPMTPDEIQSDYEWETGNVIVERFQNLDPEQVSAVLVYGHGPFTWGPSGAKAVENALALEIIAEMALKALQTNPASPPISQALLDKHFLRKHGPGAYYGQ
jgi:L-ribulose-5-phosphate 4-epimerase